MTILQPNKNKFRISFLLVGLVFAAAAAVIGNIYLYNGIVAAKHSLTAASKSLEQSQVINADLKNQLYKILDFDNLKKTAEKLSLVRVTRPSYLEAGVSVAATDLPQP